MSQPSIEAVKNAAKFPPTKTIVEQILTNAQDSRPVVQDFVPLAQSLEWELGQQYLQDRGNKAFISDASPVPFVINNNGNLSRDAAEVFFTSLLEADKTDSLQEQSPEKGNGERPHPRPLSQEERGEIYVPIAPVVARAACCLGSMLFPVNNGGVQPGFNAQPVFKNGPPFGPIGRKR